MIRATSGTEIGTETGTEIVSASVKEIAIGSGSEVGTETSLPDLAVMTTPENGGIARRNASVLIVVAWSEHPLTSCPMAMTVQLLLAVAVKTTTILSVGNREIRRG